VTTAMHTRWNDPESKRFAVSEFGRRIGGSFGMEGEAALAVGERVAAQMQSYLPNLGIADEQGQQAAQSFFESASLLLDRAVGAVSYAFGARPTLMDVCLFTGYYAHQYRDHGAAHAFLKTRTPDLCYFLDNMQAAHCAPESGELTLTDTFLDYLRYIGPPAAAFAQGTVAATESAVADSEIGKDFLRGYDPIGFRLGDQDFSRAASSFTAWKAQRVQEVYQAMDATDQARAEDVAGRIGWLDFLRQPPGYQLAREDYQIVLRSVG